MMTIEPVSFETEGGNWTTITLDNGVILKYKSEVTGVDFRGYDQAGKPIYGVSAANIVRVQHIPRELLKEPSDMMEKR